MRITATIASRVAARAATILPPGLGMAVTTAISSTTRSNKADEYAVALASASAAPAAIIHPVAS